MLKQKNACDFQFSHCLYSMLCELAAVPFQVASPSREVIDNSVEYMKTHYHEPIAVADIAAQSGVSMFYFSRLFKQAMLHSPHAYLLNIRLEQAKRRLVYTAQSIDTVAEQTGFQSTSHFIRAFKQRTNMTPNVFRNYFTAKEN